jgi:hypothetical protein
MRSQPPKPALLSRTLQFLAAGGAALIIALGREISSARPDWIDVASLGAGIVLAIGGGAWGRVTARGPITSILPRGRPRA